MHFELVCPDLTVIAASAASSATVTKLVHSVPDGTSVCNWDTYKVKIFEFLLEFEISNFHNA